MAAVESTMLTLGTKAPNFRLPIVTGGVLELATYTKYSKGIVVMFICNHCPYVKHLNEKIVELSNHYIQQGIAFIAISANDVDKYPADAPEKMIETVKREQYPFPYLYDETQEVAKSYKAACTPDFFVFDQTLTLTYRGRFDESRPGVEKEVTGEDLKAAIDAVLAGTPPVDPQVPSIGCNIKWKPGNEPDYFGT
jgi:peroxiredoxin